MSSLSEALARGLGIGVPLYGGNKTAKLPCRDCGGVVEDPTDYVCSRDRWVRDLAVRQALEVAQEKATKAWR